MLFEGCNEGLFRPAQICILEDEFPIDSLLEVVCFLLFSSGGPCSSASNSGGQGHANILYFTMVLKGSTLWFAYACCRRFCRQCFYFLLNIGRLIGNAARYTIWRSRDLLTAPRIKQKGLLFFTCASIAFLDCFLKVPSSLLEAFWAPP